MTFLIIAAEKQLYTQKKSQLQYEKTLLLSQVSTIQREMGYIEDAYNEDDDSSALDQDPEYKRLERLEENLETEQETLQAQIDFLSEVITSDKSLLTQGIKDSCGLNLTGS